MAETAAWATVRAVMEYLFAVLALVVLVVVLMARGRPGPSSAASSPEQRPGTEPAGPAADQPTPGASDTNPPERVRHAHEHTPPS